MAPLDVVFEVETTAPPAAGESAARCNLEERVLYEARRGAGGFGPDARLRVQHARPADLDAGERTLLDAMEQARAVRMLLGGARGAGPDDLEPPNRASGGTLEIPDLRDRVARAEDALLAAQAALEDFAAADGSGAEALRAALMRLHAFGVGPGVPLSAVGDDADARAALRRQARTLLQEGRGRVETVTSLRAIPLGGEPRRQRDQLVERARAVFGASFTILPRFAVDADAAGELAASLQASEALQDGDPLQVHTWFVRHERVREPLARLAAPLRTAEILSLPERLELRVAQLPFAAGDRWLGLPAKADQAPRHGALSLVVQAGAPVDVTLPLAGLWIDEWVEIVPSRTETTAITFQFNPPDACAPQSILIAVPPVPGEAWTIAGLHRVLAETLDLAKLRTLDLSRLGDVAHYLPALYFALNAQDDAVSTDFAPLIR